VVEAGAATMEAWSHPCLPQGILLYPHIYEWCFLQKCMRCACINKQSSIYLWHLPFLMNCVWLDPNEKLPNCKITEKLHLKVRLARVIMKFSYRLISFSCLCG
jgi:hypothetical protein